MYQRVHRSHNSTVHTHPVSNSTIEQNNMQKAKGSTLKGIEGSTGEEGLYTGGKSGS